MKKNKKKRNFCVRNTEIIDLELVVEEAYE
jgi:hypothetical protein